MGSKVIRLVILIRMGIGRGGLQIVTEEFSVAGDFKGKALGGAKKPILGVVAAVLPPGALGFGREGQFGDHLAARDVVGQGHS